MNDADAIDRYLERVAREEEDDLNRKHGQFILDAVDARRKGTQDDQVLEVFRRAHEEGAKATRRGPGDDAA